MITHKITNRVKYKATVEDVDLSQLKIKNRTQFEGEIFITTKQDGLLPSCGIIRSCEFESEYGFILKAG